MVRDLTKKYPKHIIFIQNTEYDLGDSFVYNGNLGDVYATLFFDFPYIKRTTFQNNEEITIIDTTNFKKYDVVKYYYREFDTGFERDTATVEDLTLIFDGYINKPTLKEAGDSQNYKIDCKSTVALTYERSMLVKSYEGNIKTLFDHGFEQTALDVVLPETSYRIDPNISSTLVLKVDTTYFFGEVLDDVKDKYAIQIYQIADKIIARFPQYLNFQPLSTSDGQGGTVLEPFVYDLESNVFNIDYGNLGSKYDSVVVIGQNARGFAFDPIAYQLKQGVREDETVRVDPTTVDVELLNPLYIFRRDINNSEDCQQLARNKLIELANEYYLSFETIYSEDVDIGSLFVIDNSSKIDNGRIWIVKDYTLKVGSSDTKVLIKAYSTSLVDFPANDLLVSKSGILDTDTLNVKVKEKALFGF